MFRNVTFSLIFLIICIAALCPAFADTNDYVIAPAIQYLREDYPSAFLSKNDYSIKLNTRRRYKLRCTSEITGVAIGDVENLFARENDEEPEEKMLYELVATKDLIIKTKNETYTYMRIFTEDGSEIVLMLSINSKNKVPNLINFANCTMFEEIN